MLGGNIGEVIGGVASGVASGINKENKQDGFVVYYVQLALIVLGLLPASNISGNWDSATEQSLKNFQISKGFEATGKIDKETANLIAMGILSVAGSSPELRKYWEPHLLGSNINDTGSPNNGNSSGSSSDVEDVPVADKPSVVDKEKKEKNFFEKLFSKDFYKEPVFWGILAVFIGILLFLKE